MYLITEGHLQNVRDCITHVTLGTEIKDYEIFNVQSTNSLPLLKAMSTMHKTNLKIHAHTRCSPEGSERVNRAL